MVATPLDPLYEILAKEVVYSYDRPEFSALATAFLAAAGYSIDQTFSDPTTGFQAIGLTSLTPNKPPVLVIRGADEAIDDVASADAQGIGFNQFQANQGAIAAWLTKVGTLVKPDIIGHSLGGAIAQTVAASDPSRVGNIVTFNSPGVSTATAAQFLSNGGSNNVTHYIVKGDFVSLGGATYLAGTAILQSFTDPAIDPTEIFRKHREIPRLLTTPPPGYSQAVISVQDLSSPGFNYSGDSDYNEFLAAFNAINPTVAAALITRQGTETLRLSPGFSFFTLVLGTEAALSSDQDNFLVGDDQANTANAAQGKDQIFGNGGDDLLRGGVGADVINGGDGQDTLLGNEGKDTLIGGTGNDTLVGGNGKDTLIGVNPEANTHPGQGEIDSLRGKADGDVFVLGEKGKVFYDDGKASRSSITDYGLIVDFQRKDVIQLQGNAENYRLQPTTGSLPKGIGIFLDQKTDELIGIVQGNSAFSLTGSAVRFV